MYIPLKEMTISLNEKTTLLYGDYSKVFPFLTSLIKTNSRNSLLFLDDFNEKTMLNEAGSFSSNKLSQMIISRFESLVELDKTLEYSETLLNRGGFNLLVLGSLPNAYLWEVSLHDPSSHSSILYLLNKILAFFSFLSQKYNCAGVLIGPREGLSGEANIPAKRIFFYWVDYVFELRRCRVGGTVGELTTKTGEKFLLCIPLNKKIDEIEVCDENECPRNI